MDSAALSSAAESTLLDGLNRGNSEALKALEEAQRAATVETEALLRSVPPEVRALLGERTGYAGYGGYTRFGCVTAVLCVPSAGRCAPSSARTRRK